MEHAVREVRELLREWEKSTAAWFVAERAEPRGLAAELRSLGLRPYDEPPYEPRAAAMVRLEAMAPGPDDVDAHVAETFEEYLAGSHMQDEVFDVSEEDRRAWEATERVRFDLQQAGKSPTCGFVALVDGEVVGSAVR